jgi:hypothetical protein
MSRRRIRSTLSGSATRPGDQLWSRNAEKLAVPAALRFVLLLMLIALMAAGLAVRERPAHAHPAPPAAALR